MDYRKDTRTPRDRVDDELLRRLLREAEEMSVECGCMATPYQNREDRSARRERRDDNDDNKSCGCNRNRRNNERSGDNGDNNSCGCNRNRRENHRDDNDDNSSCGCNRNRRENHRDDNDDNSSCGCSGRNECSGDNSYERERRDDSDNCSCMNYNSMSFQTQGLPHVMSYAPDHEFHELHEAEEALEMGTLFRELHFPFNHAACSKDKDCGCN